MSLYYPKKERYSTEDLIEITRLLRSPDGCPWDKGFSTLKEVEKECREWSKQLLEIKEKVEAVKRGE